jgi:hypothetical protein
MSKSTQNTQTAKLTPQQRIDAVVAVMTKILDGASKDSIKSMLSRPNPVRVAKVADFSISGTKLSQLFLAKDLYEIVNKVYRHAEDILSPIANGIEDATLLAQLQA